MFCFNSRTVFHCILKIIKDSLLLDALVLFIFFLTVSSSLEGNIDICDCLYFLVGEKIIIKTQDPESLDPSMLISETLVCDPKLCDVEG